MQNNFRPAAIRAARAAASLEQIALAALAGMSRKTIERAEAGELSDKTWRALVVALAGAGAVIDEDARTVTLA